MWYFKVLLQLPPQPVLALPLPQPQVMAILQILEGKTAQKEASAISRAQMETQHLLIM
jgi:hypothetical protein